MTLSDQASTGSADREAVAIALGCRKVKSDNYYRGVNIPQTVWLREGAFVSDHWPPDYQNDLAATLAEIERRGMLYRCSNTNDCRCVVYFDGRVTASSAGTTIANAAIAALLKALESLL